MADDKKILPNSRPAKETPLKPHSRVEKRDLYESFGDRKSNEQTTELIKLIVKPKGK